MAKWLNHVAIASPRNGTSTHTNVSPASGTVVAGTAFTPTAGNFLLVFCNGAVTFSTPSGWAFPSGGSAINNAGLYVFTKTATGSDTVTTTNNGSNYPCVFDFFEFPAGSTFVSPGYVSNLTANGGANPVKAGMSGTNLVLWLASSVVTSGSGPWTWTWSAGTEVTDVSQSASPTDGYAFSVAYLEDYTGSSSPANSPTVTNSGSTQERMTHAVNVAAPATNFNGSASLTATATVSPVHSGSRSAELTATAAVTAGGSVSGTPATVGFRAAGTPSFQSAAGDPAPVVPTGTTTDDMCILFLHVKATTVVPDTLAGWTLLGSANNGTTGSSADGGSIQAYIYYATGQTAGATVTVAFTASSGTTGLQGASIYSFSKGGADTWQNPTVVFGGDSTAGANYSATASGGLDVAAGDMIGAYTGVNTDAGTVSAHTISGLTGATLGTQVVDTDVGTITGGDGRLIATHAPITAGSSNATPVFTYTNASTSSGTTAFVRVRSLTGAVTNYNGTASLTVTASRTAAGSTGSGAAATAGAVAAVTAAGAVGPPASVSPSLAYNFDEGSGSSFAEANGGPAGTVLGTGSFVAGKNGTALQPTSNALAGRVGTKGAGTILTAAGWTGFTVMCWAKMGTTQGSMLGIQFTNRSADAGSVALSQNSSATQGNVGGWIYTGSAGGSFTQPIAASGIAVGDWYHQALTWTAGGPVRLFVNGVEIASGGNSGTVLGGDLRYIQVGKIDETWSSSAQAPIDDLRVFSAALSAAQILAWSNVPAAAASGGFGGDAALSVAAGVTATGSAGANLTGTATTTVAAAVTAAGSAAGGAGSVPALQGTATLVENAASATVAVTVPSGANVGELLICAVTGSRTATGDTLTAPGGWQTAALVKDGSANGVVTGLYYRVADGTEAASYTWTNTAGTAGRISGSMQRVSGADTTTPMDAAATSASLTAVAGTTIDAPSLTTVTANALLVSAAAANASSSASLTVPTGMTLINTTAGTGRRQSWASEAFPTPGATGVRTWTVGTASLQRVAILAAIRPAAAAAAPTLTSRLVGVTGRVRVFTGNATSVRLKVGTNTAVTTGVVFSSAQTPDSLGGTTHDLSSLATGVYYYRVAMTDSGAVETLDAAGTVGRIVIAPTGAANFAFCFSSCCNASDSAAMTAVAARQDDLFIHVGDLWYADATGVTVANYRTQMSGKVVAANHAAVFATIPSTYTPSDHDFGMNNNAVGTVATTAVAPFNQVYREQWPTAPVPATTGVYHTFSWGRVRFIIMDTRTFKSDPALTDNSSKTMLGTTQKQWVKDTITAATEPVIVMVTDVPWTGTTTAGQDDWSGFNTERQELASFLVASGKKSVFLGGDMHAVAAASGSSTAQGIPNYQASPLNNNASIKGTPWDSVYPTSGSAVVQQYGRVVVTDTGSQITLAFTGYSSDNTSRVTRTDVFPAVQGTVGTSSLTVAAAVSAAGALGVSTGAALTVTAAPTATGANSWTGTAAPTAAAAVSATGAAGLDRGANPSAAATLTATGSTGLAGTASLTVTAARAAAGLATSANGASLAVTAAATAAGQVAVTGSAAPTVTATVGAVGQTNVAGTATRTTTAAVSTAGATGLTGTAALTVAAAVTPTQSLATGSAASSSVTASISGSGLVNRSSGAALTVTPVILATSTGGASPATVTVTAGVTAAGATGLATGAQLTVTSTTGAGAGRQSSAALTVAAATTAVGALAAARDAAVTVAAVISATGSVGVSRSASLTVTAAVSSTTTTAVGRPGSATVTAAVTATGQLAGGAAAAPTVAAVVTAAGAVARFGAAALTVAAGIPTAGATGASAAAVLNVTVTHTPVGLLTGTSTGAARTVTVQVAAGGTVAAASGAALVVTAVLTLETYAGTDAFTSEPITVTNPRVTGPRVGDGRAPEISVQPRAGLISVGRGRQTSRG